MLSKTNKQSNKIEEPGVVVDTCNSNTWKADSHGPLVILRPT